MAHILGLKPLYQQTRSGVIATIRAVARAIASEHTLALHASEKVASSCRHAAEVRAMYVLTPNKESDSDAATRLRGAPADANYAGEQRCRSEPAASNV